MSKTSRLSIVCVAALMPTGRVAAQRINTRPGFQMGQQFTLRMVLKTDDARDNPPRKSYATPVMLRVVRNSTAGTDLEWVAGKSVRLDAQEPPNPMLEMVEKIFEDLHLMVHLDGSGRYQGIQNEEDLRAKIQEFVLLLIPQATAKIQDAAERRRAADAMGKMLTPQALLSAARKEIDLFFGLSGLPLEVGKPLRMKSSAMNPFGERGGLEDEMEITPVEVDSVKGEAIIEFRQEFDPQTPGESVSGSNPAAGAGAAAARLTLKDSGEYVLELSSGRVKRVRHVRAILQDGEAVRVETTEITVQ